MCHVPRLQLLKGQSGVFPSGKRSVLWGVGEQFHEQPKDVQTAFPSASVFPRCHKSHRRSMCPVNW